MLLPSHALLGNVSKSAYPLHSYSLEFPFIDTPFENRFWNYGGDTLVDLRNSRILLTADRQHQRGWVWSKQPMSGNAWVVDVEFKVQGTSGAFHGDGFAFWYTADKENQGPVFGNKDYFKGLGVLFDTYKNSHYHPFNFPYVSVQVNDGTQSYSAFTDGKQGEVGGCSASFRNVQWSTYARIEYVKNDFLRVSVSVDGANQWTECVYMEDPPSLPDNGYLGFTSHTGDATDNHEILRVVTNGLTNPKAYKLSLNHLNAINDAIAQVAKSGSSAGNALRLEGGSFDSSQGIFGEAFLLVMGVGSFFVIALGGFLYWKKRQGGGKEGGSLGVSLGFSGGGHKASYSKRF
ncbi:legume-like lectin family-domain-containing protein [Chytriomyces sp. MP71]|nr:legume-like lectin family-domain-containing protein [Chytriomyces sp. MP71]